MHYAESLWDADDARRGSQPAPEQMRRVGLLPSASRAPGAARPQTALKPALEDCRPDEQRGWACYLGWTVLPAPSCLRPQRPSVTCPVPRGSSSSEQQWRRTTQKQIETQSPSPGRTSTALRTTAARAPRGLLLDRPLAGSSAARPGELVSRPCRNSASLYHRWATPIHARAGHCLHAPARKNRKIVHP